MQILIAEDDKLHRAFLHKITSEALPRLDRITQADDGRTALELFQAGNYESVILDLQMPKMTGVELARAIWSSKPRTRILFWSNYSDQAYMRGIARIVPDDGVYG